MELARCAHRGERDPRPVGDPAPGRARRSAQRQEERDERDLAPRTNCEVAFAGNSSTFQFVNVAENARNQRAQRSSVKHGIREGQIRNFSILNVKNAF